MPEAKLKPLSPPKAELCPPASLPLTLTLGIFKPSHSAYRMPQLNLGLAQDVGRLEACLPSADGLAELGTAAAPGPVKEQRVS